MFNVQIGLIMLIGLSAKNAILIVEYAKTEVEKGKSLTEAALIGARIRLRPILMTSFAFVFGCLPLWFATGFRRDVARDAGHGGHWRNARFDIAGHIIIPVNFYVVENWDSIQEAPARAATEGRENMSAPRRFKLCQ